MAQADAEDAGGYVPPTGGYSVQCPWLLDTSLMVTHLLSSADFYVNVADPQYGGFFTDLDRQGNPKTTNKSFQVQGRDASAFARAFLVSGNPKYLTAARQALDFLYAHGWDTQNGGFVFLGDQKGNWLQAPGVKSEKWSFAQNYALAGSTGMCEATQNSTDCGWMNKGMQLLETRYLDPVYGGYFDQATVNYSSLSGKGFTPTVDALTPHILLTVLLTGNAAYEARAVSLSNDVVNHMVASMTAQGVKFGFPQYFNDNWSIATKQTSGSIGHLYKAAWALARATMLTGDSKYQAAARQVLMQLWTNGGFDHVNGGPNFDYHYNSGLGSTDKNFWELEQGFTSGITNWYIATTDADRRAFVEQAERSLCFFMRHLPDSAYGSIFFQTNADGSTLISDGYAAPTDKGDQWDGAYHNVELSYYAYVYGNLLFWRRPVTLYYSFDATTQDRAIVLNPVESHSSDYAIQSVTLAGQPYSAYDGATRALTVPAGTGGIFAVTYVHTP